MSKIRLETLSSANTGQHQTLINLTDALATTETIDTVSAVPVDAAVITVLSATVNGGPVTENGTTVATGKGILLVVSAIASSESNQEIRMRVVGTENFKRDYEMIQPVQIYIKE